MASSKEYYIGDRSVTTGRIFGKGKPVTAEIMGISAEAFMGLVKSGTIKEGKPGSAKVKAVADARTPEEIAQAARVDKIVEAIGTLYSADGKQMSEGDFTEAGIPKCDVLETVLKDVEGFATVAGPERDEAYQLYRAKVAG